MSSPLFRIQVLSWKPRAFVYHNFLSVSEVRHVLQLAAPQVRTGGGASSTGSTQQRPVQAPASSATDPHTVFACCLALLASFQTSLGVTHRRQWQGPALGCPVASSMLYWLPRTSSVHSPFPHPPTPHTLHRTPCCPPHFHTPDEALHGGGPQ